jgi:hypothetical protein
MRKIVILSILLLAATSFAVSSEEVTFTNNWGKNPMFNIASKSDAGMEIVFSIHKMVVEEMQIDGATMKTYGIPGIFLPNNEGAPNLAGTGRYIAIPQGATAKVTIVDARTEIYHNIEIAPAPNIPSDNDDSPQRYVKDMSIYGKNEYYPETPVKLSSPMQMRGVDCVILGITPFQYNPITKDLIVYKDIRVRIDFEGGNGHFGDDALRSIYWQPILQGNLLNYSSLPQIDFFAPSRVKARDGYEYIIIVPDDPIFQAWGDTIKKWRTLQGISTQVFTLTQVGGNTTTAIENFINNAYNTWSPRPVAFLLLSDYPSSGDIYGITSPTYTYSGETVVSDNTYADVNGDNLPDMLQARICAQNESQLSIMINKFLSYERNPYTDPNFYNQPLVACAWSSATGDARWFQLCGEVVRGFFINNLGKNPARQYAIYNGTPTVGGPWSSATNTATVVNYFSNLGYIPTTNQHDATWWSNGSVSGITAAINSGAFLVQHRDHGYVQGWGEPAYSSSNIASLTNNKYTWVNSTNCQTGEYNYATPCFVETFHRSQYGALGANAPSEVSYSFVNDVYIWGWYDCMWQQFMPDYPAADITPYGTLLPSAAMVYGKYFLGASSWPYIPQYDNLTYHLFHHHGDAFNALYTEVPQNLTVVHMPTILAGTSTFTVTANDSSVIALTANGEIIGVARGTGNPVAITITPQIPGTNVIVTVTKPNYYRYQVTVPVASLLTLVSPNSGEIWPGGTNQQIKWRTVGTGFDRYRLLLSRNGGSTYTDTIAHNVAPTETTYNWLVPTINYTTCRVMVQMLDTSSLVILQDTSDGNFTIQTTVTMVSPNGGEIWPGGTNQLIKWRTVGFARYCILLSRNGGSTYTDTIVRNVTLIESTYVWLTPVMNITTCRILVQMLDTLGSVISQDASNTNFTIQTLPTVVSPNGGEICPGGTNQLIKWRTVGFARYRILLSRNSGSTYTDTIAHNVAPTETTYNWLVPTINSTTCRVMVQMLDTSGFVISQDTSDGNFTIQTAVTVVSPNGGEIWPGGTNQLIKWRTIGFARYCISLSRNGGLSYTDTIAYNITPTETTYNWFVPTINYTTCRVMVQMLDAGGSVIVQDVSDANFTIDADLPSTFSLISPPNGAWASELPTFVWRRSIDNFALSHYQLSITIPNDTIKITNITDTIYTASFVDWTQATANASWSARSAYASVVFDNKIWVMGGYDNSFRNDVWYSTDGVTWTQATANAGWSARYNHTSVVFDNKMWVIGGYDASGRRNDVWYSTDGVTWTQATTNANWSVRWEHTSVVYDNKMWVMGGFNASGRSNDVWYSTDGINWTQATANAGWSARYLHSSVVYDNKMWVMGGYDNSFRNDVWFSTDGINWAQAAASARWSARDNYTSVVYDNKMWVMGGEDVSGRRNDVWYSSLIPPFLPEGLRTWWVTAFDKAGNQRRSTQVFSVHIDSTPPMAFNLLLPADSIWSTGTGLTYSWQASSDAGVGLMKYQLWINDILNRDNILPTQTSTTHTGTLGTGTYTWQIRAIDSVGNTRISNQTRVLRVDVTLPNEFSLVSPSNYSWTPQRHPRFIWRATSDIGIGLRIYQLYINGVPRDSIQPPDTSLVSPIALSDGSNNWYIRAIDGLGNWTNTSTWYVTVDSTPPTSFNLVSPPDSGLRNIPTPNLTWRKSTDAGIGFKKYELWIDNVRNIDSLGQNDTVATPYNPLSEGYYTWFVKAFDQLENASNSNQTFTVILDWNIPDTFNLSFPYDNDTTNSLQPTLYWHPSYDIGSGVRRYQLWINGLLNRDSIPPSDTFTTPINLLANNTSNTWFIKAIDLTGGTRSSNQTWRFVTSDLIPPTVPILISPSNNGYIKDSLPKFWWHKSTDISGIDYYQLQYAMDSNFTGAVTVNVYDTSHQVPNRLNDTTYYWRVKSFDRGGNQSNWTATWIFEVDTRIPLTPTLLEPVNGIWQNTSNVIFRWTSVSFDKMMKLQDIADLNLEQDRDIKVNYSTEILSPIRYIMQVDTNRNFTTPLFIDTTNLTQDTLNIGERRKCYWRVRGYDLSGNQGVFSNIDSFGNDLTPTSTPQLVAPDSGAIINTQTVNFIWRRSTDNLSGVRYYTLQYATTYLFLSPVTLDSITDTTRVSLPLGDSIYYWRVRSKDFAGNISSWSLIRSFRVDNTSPLVPSLVIPVNGYITNNSNVIFIWRRSISSDISFYTLQYCRNSSFSGADSVARIDTFYITALTDTTYYWRVRAVDSASNRSDWSSVWSFEVDAGIPNTPALVYPVNGVWFTNMTVIFNWSMVSFNVKSPVQYILEVDTSRVFTNPIVDTTGILYDTLTLTQARYFWRVRAYDLAGNQGAFSGRDSFGVDVTASGIPNLIGPANGSMTNNANITFLWNRSTDNLSGVLRYTLEYARNSGFSNPTDTIVTDTTITLILTDTIYYWRVKSQDRAGNQSSWSSTRNFELDTRIPNAPTLVSPVNGVWSINTSITFSWSQVTFNAKSPIRYILQVDASVNFINPITDTTSFVYDTLELTQARYYWRVRAYDLAGNQGTFSGRDSFGIDYTAPSVPNLISPVNGAILTDSFVTFIWNRSTDNVSGVRNYQIQIANNFGLNNPFDTTLTDTTYLRRLSDTTYYWQVKSIDYANNQSPWSSIRNFRVQTTGIEEILDATKLLIFSLGQNSPNPFFRLTEIRYAIPFRTKVKIAVFSSTGEDIITLTDGIQNQGWYSVRWNGKDSKGKICPNGIYFYRLVTDEYQATRKMLMLK